MLDLPCTQATLTAKLTNQGNDDKKGGGGEISWNVSTHEMATIRGDFIHKLAARALIRDWDEVCSVCVCGCVGVWVWGPNNFIGIIFSEWCRKCTLTKRS